MKGAANYGRRKIDTRPKWRLKKETRTDCEPGSLRSSLCRAAYRSEEAASGLWMWRTSLCAARAVIIRERTSSSYLTYAQLLPLPPPPPTPHPVLRCAKRRRHRQLFCFLSKKKQQKVRPQCNRVEYYSFKYFSFISIEINFESRREVSLICSTYFSLHSFKKNTSYTYSILINLNWFLPNFVFQGNRLDSLMSSDSYFLFCLMLHLVA